MDKLYNVYMVNVVYVVEAKVINYTPFKILTILRQFQQN